MKRTYTGTWTMSNEELRKATIKLYIFEGVKYNDHEPIAETEYTGVTAWDIIEDGEEAKEIEAETDASSIDEYHEYLILHFEDGTTSTFRNSHVDMHIR